MASPPSTQALAPRKVASILRQLDATYRDETWHWMPDRIDGPMDIIAGAILVQHTSWTNAARALEVLRAASALDAETLARTPVDQLEALVRVSGTPSIKARRLQAVALTILDAGGLGALLALPTAELRARLLGTHGVGPETADAIALYAAGRRVFVVDAYTRRMFRRIGVGPTSDHYDGWQRFLDAALPSSATVDDYRRYHASIVLHCKALCRVTPRCGACPLREQCATGIASG